MSFVITQLREWACAYLNTIKQRYGWIHFKNPFIAERSFKLQIHDVVHCLVGFMVHIITVSCPYWALRTTDNDKAAGRSMDCKGEHFLRIDDGRTKTGLNVTFKLPCKCLSLGLHYMLSTQYDVNASLQRAHQMETRHRRGMGCGEFKVWNTWYCSRCPIVCNILYNRLRYVKFIIFVLNSIFA